jgi:uncharacterized protein (TIGR03067 family)
VAKKLPARPNLDHLRGQAKTLLAQWRDGDPATKRRLADAQLEIARTTGFANWPALSRYVQQLRGLEGEWRFDSLQVDGKAIPAAMIAETRLLIDGDRFRTESPEANYDGIFTIDVETAPTQIDIEFVEGPEAGNWSYGLYDLDGDRLTLCLSLVAGGTRPKTFATNAGGGHALERLRRVTASRPANVTGGTAQPPKKGSTVEREDSSAFAGPERPGLQEMMRQLEGEWAPVELVMDGKPMPEQWLSFGSRTMAGNEMKVIFGGQTMVHAKVRVDGSVTPIAIDYLSLKGKETGIVSRGILEWIGDEFRVLMAAPGEPRPAAFGAPSKTQTLSRWRKPGA